MTCDTACREPGGDGKDRSGGTGHTTDGPRKRDAERKGPSHERRPAARLHLHGTATGGADAEKGQGFGAAPAGGREPGRGARAEREVTAEGCGLSSAGDQKHSKFVVVGAQLREFTKAP